MASNTYQSVVLAKRPKDEIISGTFKLQTNPTPNASDLKANEVLLRTIYLSLDPAMRGWLNDTRSYVPPVQIGEVMRGGMIGQVLASTSPDFTVGSYAQGTVGWTELAVAKAKHLEKVEIPSNGQLTDAMGVLGMTGLTAYFGLLDVGKVKKGDLVVVSGAAGATGSVVGQIAKIKGARVVGLAGSEEKVEWLKRELGFDEALNYKSKSFVKDFRAATKYSGGEILDIALSRAKPHSRYVICGGISQYNSSKPQGPKNYLMIISMRITMQGFIVFDYESRYAEARRELSQWLSEGKIKRKETIVKGGLPAAEQALRDLYRGMNTGKLLVEVTPPDSMSGTSGRAKL